LVHYRAMDRDTVTQALRDIVEGQSIAALGTLHDGEPYVSMVPFALVPGAEFVIHVSGLAAHTRDMLEHPAVSLLVVAPPSPEVAPQALARMTVQGEARPLAAGTPGHAVAKDAYLTRFPQSAMTFELGDFALFAIRPRSIRLVGGFAQAKTVTPETFARAFDVD
jgi:putative heme iron utilization protein